MVSVSIDYNTVICKIVYITDQQRNMITSRSLLTCNSRDGIRILVGGSRCDATTLWKCRYNHLHITDQQDCTSLSFAILLLRGNVLRLARFLHLRLHFHDFLAILPMAILLTIPVELLAVSVAVAKRSAPATLLAHFTMQFSSAATTNITGAACGFPHNTDNIY